MFSFREFLSTFVIALSLVNFSAGQTTITVGYFAANSNCGSDASPAIPSATFNLNQCYSGTMYTCSLANGHMSYLTFADSGWKFCELFIYFLNVCFYSACGSGRFPSAIALRTSQCVTGGSTSFSTQDVQFSCQ